MELMNMSTQKRKMWNRMSMTRYIDYYNQEEKIMIEKICSNDFEYISKNIHKADDPLVDFLIMKKHNDYFCIACWFSSDVRIVKYLYKEYKIKINDVNIKNIDCFLMTCCINECVDIIRYLVENTGIDIAARDKEGNTYLHIASEKNTPIVFEYLIEKGLDPRSLNKEGFNCLMRACYLNHNLETIKYFVEIIGMNPFQTLLKKQNCLTLACQRNNITVIKYLIEEKMMDPFYQDAKGYNCLMWACYINNLDEIKYLINVMRIDKIKNDDKKNHTHDNNYSYLITACRNNTDVNVLKYLIEEIGLDMNHLDSNGNSCFYHAYSNENLDVIKYLIECTTIRIKLYDLPLSYYKSILKHLRLNSQRINEFIKKGIKIYGTVCVLKGTMFYTNPLVFDIEICELIDLNPFKFEHHVFTRFADTLFCKLLLEDVMNFCYSDKNDIENVKNIQEIDNNINQLLFYHNGIPYYGSRKIVYESILLLNDINFLNHNNNDEPINLLIDVSSYIIKLYIDSCYDAKFDINLIKPENFLNFLRLIDQYPTTNLSIEKMESQLINYMNKNKIVFDNYIEATVSKYNLKCMYLFCKGKLVNKICVHKFDVFETIP